MLSFDSTISSVSHFAVLNVRFIMGIDTLQRPSVVVIRGDLSKIGAYQVRSNDGDSNLVTVVLEQKATGKVSPRKRHN